MSETHPAPPQPVPGRNAFWHGLRCLPLIPALTLFSTAVGFGALAKSAGLTFFDTFVISTLVFALPAQVVFADEWARGASLIAIAIAVTLTAVRLLPMTVSLMPLLRDPDAPKASAFRPSHLLTVHFIAITTWLEMQRMLDTAGHRANRIPFFIGLGAGLSATTTLGGATGYLIASDVGMVGGAVLLFMTPIYFFISLLASARIPADWLAIGFGVVLGPLLFLVTPSFALALTGLIGGTIAYLVGQRIDRDRNTRDKA